MNKKGFVDIITGGQAGSEGKGGLIEWLSENPPKEDYSAAIKPGSINSGHSVNPKYSNSEKEYVHQSIPSMGSLRDDILLMIAPEASFSLEVIEQEIKDIKEGWGNIDLYIDPFSAIITSEHVEKEKQKKLGEEIASTVHGCGAVKAEKIWRSAGNVTLAKDCPRISEYTGKERVPIKAIGKGKEGRVMIEGTQGVLLSMNQSNWYPFTTSRDCTAPSFLSSCGLPLSSVADVWSVFRTYPIRVGGNSGPLEGEEITFEKIAERSGHKEPPVEMTSVTNKKRRIFEWSWEEFEYSLSLNDPDYIALTFIDYINVEDKRKRKYDNLSEESKKFIRKVEKQANKTTNTTVGMVSTGPKVEHSIDLRNKNIL